MARKAESPVSFVLRDAKAKAQTPIIGLVRFDNDRIKVATGFKVWPAHWSDTRHRVKNVVDAADKDQINTFLDGLQKEIGTITADLKAARQLTKETLKERIDKYLKPEPAPLAPTEPVLFTFIRDFIEKSPERINPNSGKKIEYRTIQKYKTVFSVLQDFSLTYPRVIDFETVDLDFYFDFTQYLTGKNFSTNNVGKYIQTLKTFLNEATAKGHNAKQDYKSRRFKVVKEDADSIYLAEDELKTLYSFDLSKKPRLEKVRDLFIVGCYTGLRFSDLTNIKPQFIRNGIIRLEQFKTGDDVVIPCHPLVTAILDKYDGNLPQSISNQKMNDYLKEVCKLVEMTDHVSKAITKGGLRITKSFEKWEMVSTHTARRSFATNMYLMGVPSITIMKITGHRTESAFMKYIKLSGEEHATIMLNLWQKQQRESPFIKIA